MLSNLNLSQDEVDSIWEDFRYLSMNGISTHSDIEIRNLHARLNLLLSLAIIELGKLEQELARKEVSLNSTKALLMHTKYTEYSTVKKNEYAMETDEKYINEQYECVDIQRNVIVQRAEVNALEKACGVLSREISYRIKGN